MRAARDEARRDWRLTMAAGALTLALDLFFLGLQAVTAFPWDDPLPLVAHAVFVGLVMVALWLSRRAPSTALCAALFCAMVLPTFLVLWLFQHDRAAAGRAGFVWTPFIGHRVAMLIVAAFCPRPRWLAPALLALFAAQQVILWIQLDLGPSAGVPSDEPWVSLTFVLVTFGLYGLRVYHERVERELARAREAEAGLRRVNEAFVTLRDMANTPLQNLELAIALLQRGHARTEKLLERSRRAIDRLRQLGALFPVGGPVSASVDPSVIQREDDEGRPGSARRS